MVCVCVWFVYGVGVCVVRVVCLCVCVRREIFAPFRIYCSSISAIDFCLNGTNGTNGTKYRRMGRSIIVVLLVPKQGNFAVAPDMFNHFGIALWTKESALELNGLGWVRLG